MNKIYSDQMTKATLLAEGTRKKADTLREHGIEPQPDALEAACKALEEAAVKQEEAENKLKEMRTEAHEKLEHLKQLCTEIKAPIKLNFAPETWEKFGLTDKR